jgi:hypothetical protein
MLPRLMWVIFGAVTSLGCCWRWASIAVLYCRVAAIARFEWVLGEVREENVCGDDIHISILWMRWNVQERSIDVLLTFTRDSSCCCLVPCLESKRTLRAVQCRCPEIRTKAGKITLNT